MFSYLMLALGRPVLNPAPLPEFNTDQSYKHRRASAEDVFSFGADHALAERRKLKSSESDQATKIGIGGSLTTALLPHHLVSGLIL